MDQQNRDIYQSQKQGPQKAEDRPVVEMSPAEIRARTRRSTMGFSIAMLVLFAAATWYIYVEEKKSIRPAGEPDLEPPSFVTRTASLTSPPASRAVAPTTATIPIPEPGGESTQKPPPGLDPERMAQAMGETRSGFDYLRAKEFDKAEERARKALEIWPDMNAALRLLGVVYTQRGQFDQAIVVLEQALKSDPFSAETYNNLATAYMQRGMMEKAEEMLQTSLQITPGYRIAYLNLGLLNLMRARYDSAADYLERALEEYPNDPAPRNNLAVALIRLGRYEDARHHLQMILDLSPQVPNTYFNLAISYVLEGNFDDAMTWIKRGAQHCSPVQCQRFLTDNDFNGIRGQPQFQEFLQSLYPDLPQPPQG